MKRNLNKTLRSGIFQSIAMKLVRTDIEDFEKSRKELADKLYEWNYKKDLKLINSLPDDFLSTSSRIHIEGMSVIGLQINSVGSYYIPERESERNQSWSSRNSQIDFTTSKRSKHGHNYSISIRKEDLPAALISKIKKTDQKGKDLYEKMDKLMLELKGVLNSCNTVQKLREVLPEFDELYPEDEKYNLPVVIPSSSLLKKAAKNFTKNNGDSK